LIVLVKLGTFLMVKQNGLYPLSRWICDLWKWVGEIDPWNPYFETRLHIHLRGLQNAKKVIWFIDAQKKKPTFLHTPRASKQSSPSSLSRKSKSFFHKFMRNVLRFFSSSLKLEMSVHVQTDKKKEVRGKVIYQHVFLPLSLSFSTREWKWERYFFDKRKRTKENLPQKYSSAIVLLLIDGWKQRRDFFFFRLRRRRRSL